MTRSFPLRVLLLLVFLLCAVRASAAGVPGRPFVLVLLPGTSLSEWRSANAPTLHRLMATGAVAVMNTRTARLPNDHRRETPESAALTLGMGARAAGGDEIAQFFRADRVSGIGQANYGQLSMRRTGARASHAGSVNVQWPRVVRENNSLGYDALPGNLGSALSKHGVPPGAGGGRMAFVVAADRNGFVPVRVPGPHLPRPLPPFLVWDAGGDIASADTVLGLIATEVGARGGRLVVLSPSAGDPQFARGERLTPVVLWGPGVPPGLLLSPATHRPGLVTNTDMAPTVTAFFGDAQAGSWLPVAPFGGPLRPVPHAGAVESVAQLERGAYRQAGGMKVLPFVAVCLGLLAATSAFRSWQGRSSLVPCWVPGVVVFSLLVSPTPVAALLWAGCLSFIFGMSQKHVRPDRLVLTISGVTILALVSDMLTGGRLMRQTLLGYSAIEGARYYGIGNEAMGPLVGSALAAAAILWRPTRLHFTITSTALLGLALLIGMPAAGAKAGGLLVALAAFTTLLWVGRGGRVSVRPVAVLVAAALLVLALVSVADWHRQIGARTHIGAAVARIVGGGVGEAWDIIRRKMFVESRLMTHSAWAVPLWMGVLGLAACLRRDRATGDRRTKALLSGGAVAIMACLAVNDAGAVAAALCGTVLLGGADALQTQKSPPEK